MFKWLKLKLATFNKGKKDDFKRDQFGHAIANHHDVDDFPNEPDDSPTPPTRLPQEAKERENLWKDIMGPL